MHQRVAILIQRGNVTSDRQADVCASHCLENRYIIQTIVPWWAFDQAARLVRDGLADVVVVAYEGKGISEVIAQVVEAGGKVIAVHPEPRELEPPAHRMARWATELVARWHRRGKNAHQIAELLDEDTTDITSVLLQLGFDPTRR